MHFHRKPVQISDSFEFKINIQEDKKKFLIQIDESIHPNVIENDISIKRERSRGRKSYHSWWVYLYTEVHVFYLII